MTDEPVISMASIRTLSLAGLYRLKSRGEHRHTTCIMQLLEKKTLLYCYPYKYNKHKLSLSVTYVFILLFHHLLLVPPKFLLLIRFPTLNDACFSDLSRA